MESWSGLFEFGIVAMFALGWWVLELQGKRLDRKRAEEQARAAESKTD